MVEVAGSNPAGVTNIATNEAIMKLSKSPTREEVQALADLPHGKAEEVLIKNKMWDWSQDPDMNRYEVEVVAEVSMTAYSGVEVWAKSEKDAREQVGKMKVSEFTWETEEYEMNFDHGWDVDTIRKID